jgi:hypothetical protein
MLDYICLSSFTLVLLFIPLSLHYLIQLKKFKTNTTRTLHLDFVMGLIQYKQANTKGATATSSLD